MIVGGLEAVVTVAELGVDLGRTPVLRGLDLVVGAGEVVGILGPNGSGKSTLLRVLATLLPPTAGGGSVLGARLSSAAVHGVRPSIGLVGHDSGLHPRLTLAENLRYLAVLTGRPDEQAREALDVAGLARAAGRRAEQCSQGMRRRADLARILVTEPSLLLLDEPHAGLDRSSFGLVDLVAQGVRARGGAVVIVSHDSPRLASLADRLLELDAGRLVPAGTGMVSEGPR
ncbi:ABC transporter ATP-binding protein [Amycolatopsis tucumanensis]|uniref:ABC transporter ATP-binding protein n=1 Tax=Amycolatopsis tucumanensis TaxID=401106 RepID=UPI001F41B7AB|nr:ABC transporter ATP-binding protein [Amycolatopsis tucumanensis]MCF6429156.1 ABC transporter ATP-binding protein [Amycolatopsis tucumanensis]